MHTFENWLWYNLPTLWVENENLKWISFSFFKWHKTEEDNNEKFKMNFSTQVSDLCRHSPRCCFNGKKFVERQRNACQLNCAEPYYKILGCIFWTSWKDLPRYIVLNALGGFLQQFIIKRFLSVCLLILKLTFATHSNHYEPCGEECGDLCSAKMRN